MGWSEINTKFGAKLRADDVRSLIYQEFDSAVSQVKSVSIKGNVAYVLESRQVKNSETTVMTVTVVLFEYKQKVFRYKSMNESEGPYYFELPNKFLPLLTPVDQWPESARADVASWRNKVAAYKRAKKLLDEATSAHIKGKTQYVLVRKSIHDWWCDNGTLNTVWKVEHGRYFRKYTNRNWLSTVTMHLGEPLLGGFKPQSEFFTFELEVFDNVHAAFAAASQASLT